MAESAIDKSDLILDQIRRQGEEIGALTEAIRGTNETLVKGFARMSSPDVGASARGTPWLVLIAAFGLLGTFMGPLYLLNTQTRDSVASLSTTARGRDTDLHLMLEAIELRLERNTAEMAADKADDQARFSHVADVVNLQHQFLDRVFAMLWEQQFPGARVPSLDYWPLADPE